MSDELVRLAINDLLALTQKAAKNIAEPVNVRAFASIVNERLRAIAKLLPATVHVDVAPVDVPPAPPS
jgi:hypothetical protein